MSNLQTLVTKLNTEVEESARHETHLVAEIKAMERSLQRTNESLQNEEQRNGYLEKKLKLLTDDRQSSQDLLQSEKQKSAELVTEQQTLVKEVHALQAAVTGAETDRDTLRRALKDANNAHQEELKKLATDLQQQHDDGVHIKDKKKMEDNLHQKVIFWQLSCYRDKNLEINKIKMFSLYLKALFKN